MVAAIELTQQTLDSWGPPALGVVVAVFVVVLALAKRFAEVAVFLASAGLVAWLLFAGGIGTIGELSGKVAP
jgi:hypothetical protein